MNLNDWTFLAEVEINHWSVSVVKKGGDAAMSHLISWSVFGDDVDAASTHAIV